MSNLMKTDFELSYFDDQIVDGFFVPGMIRRSWANQMRLLKEVDSLCRKYNITYFAEWGTLLGAIRHHGFIPWDDDLDICMKRSDYNRFLQVMHELPDYIKINNFHTVEGVTDFMSRLVNSYGINTKRDFLENSYELPFVCGIDIFVMDSVIDDTDLLEKQVEKIDEVSSHIGRAQAGLITSGKEEQLERVYIKQVRKQFGLSEETEHTLLQDLYILAEDLMALYSGETYENQTSYYTLMPLYVKHHGPKYPKAYYASVKELPFENIKIPLPVGYKRLISLKYHEYWKLVKNGSTHNYPFYREQEQILLEHVKSLPYYFSFDSKVLEHKKKAERKSFEKIYENYYSLLQDICKMFIASCENQSELSGDFLEQSQKFAIDFGGVIESVYGEGCEFVHPLEQFCEIIYAFSEGERSLELANEILRVLKEMDAPLKEEIHKHKRVIFLVHSEKMLKEYRKYAEQYHVEDYVYFILVPFYRKRPDGTILERVYDSSLLVKYDELFGYEELDLYKLYPDMIYSPQIYDDHSSWYQIEKNFENKDLYLLTPKLIYFAPMDCFSFSKESARSYQNLDYYLTMPGALYVDEILVPDEILKDAYQSKLIEWSGEAYKDYWKQVVCVYKKPKPYSTKEVVKGNKGIAIYLNPILCVSDLETRFHKMERIMSSINDVSNLTVYWIVDQDLSKYEEPAGWQDELKSYIMNYETQIEFNFISSMDLLSYIDQLDGYYGDPGRFVETFSYYQKPVMIMDDEI